MALDPQFIVTPRGSSKDSFEQMREFLSVVEGNPEISISRVVGSKDSPSRLIIRGVPDAVAKLKARFDSKLIIEEDRPLGLAGN